MTTTPIKIDIVSDVACPWCYVGKRRLEAALAQWEETPVEIEWHPFQLDPSMPAEGKYRDEYLVSKFGDLESTKQMTSSITEVGKDLGIDFDFGEKWLAVNTLPLHQLLEIAGQEGFKDALKERFFKAYFVNLEPLNDMEVLFQIMGEFGWSADKVHSIINDPAVGNVVNNKIKHFQKLGVTGVPFFVINNTYGISGAQSPETLVNALRQVSQEQEELKTTTGDQCDIDAGDC